MIDNPVRTGTNEDAFKRVLAAASTALDADGVPHLFMGGVASMVLGRTSWTHDIDIFVARSHEPDALDALKAAGFAIEPFMSTWLSKATREGVTVDIIHCSSGPTFLDEEMLKHAVDGEVWGVKVRVLSAEDLVVTKTLAHNEETWHYWWDVLAVIANCELDWDYLVRRARRGPRRMLSMLLYAQSIDLTVPDWAVRQLFDSVSTAPLEGAR